jgi:hypothetical protein
MRSRCTGALLSLLKNESSPNPTWKVACRSSSAETKPVGVPTDSPNPSQAARRHSGPSLSNQCCRISAILPPETEFTDPSLSSM